MQQTVFFKIPFFCFSTITVYLMHLKKYWKSIKIVIVAYKKSLDTIPVVKSQNMIDLLGLNWLSMTH